MNQLFCSWAAGPGGRGTARPPGSGSPGRTPASRWRGRSGGRGGQRTCPVRTAGHCYTPALVWALPSRAPPRRRQPRPRRVRAQRSRPARICWLLPCRSRRGRAGGGETARAVEGGVAAGQPGWVAGGPSHARVDGGEAPVQLAGDCGGAARPAARTRKAQLSKNIQIWLWWLFSCAATLYPTPFFFFFFSCPSMVCGRQDCGSCVGLCGAKRHREGRGAPKPNQNWKSIPNQTKPKETKVNQNSA